MKNFVLSLGVLVLLTSSFVKAETTIKDVRPASKVFQDSLQLLNEAKNHRDSEIVSEVAEASARDLAKFLSLAYQALINGDVDDIVAIRGHLELYADEASSLPEEVQKAQLVILARQLNKLKFPKSERDLRAEMSRASKVYWDSLGLNLRFKATFLAVQTIALLAGDLSYYEHIVGNSKVYGAFFFGPEIATALYGALRYGMRPTGKTLTEEERNHFREVEQDLHHLSLARDWNSCQRLLSGALNGASGGGLKITL